MVGGAVAGSGAELSYQRLSDIVFFHIFRTLISISFHLCHVSNKNERTTHNTTTALSTGNQLSWISYQEEANESIRA